MGMYVSVNKSKTRGIDVSVHAYSDKLDRTHGWVTLSFGDGDEFTIHGLNADAIEILGDKFALASAKMRQLTAATASDATAANRHETPLQPLEARSE